MEFPKVQEKMELKENEILVVITTDFLNEDFYIAGVATSFEKALQIRDNELDYYRLNNWDPSHYQVEFVKKKLQ